MYRIKNGDCLEIMKNIKDNCIDVSFTSPPYNDTGNKNNDVSVSDEGGCTHKKYVYVEQRKDWLEWQIECIDEMLRISKKYVLYNIQALSKNRKNVYALIGHYADRIHDIIIWNKPNGLPTSTPNKISNTYEMVIILKCDGVTGVDVSSKFFRNVITLNGNSNREYSKIHRAVMSQEFSDEIIKEFTNKGDKVLDCFMGLATTGISCLKLDRDFFGIEIVKEYYDIAEKRLQSVKGEINDRN